jgi:hypothetical protein
LARGERLADAERASLNAHYGAGLETHHLRGLLHGLDEQGRPAEPRDAAVGVPS